MAKLFEKINELTTQWFDSLSEREKKLLAILSVFICILLVFATFYIAGAKIKDRTERLNKNKDQLAKVLELEEEYLFTKEKNENALRSISRNNVSLFTFIQSVTSRLGLSVKDLDEQKRPLPKSNVVEVKVQVNLSKLSIDKVTALIEAIETSEESEHVKITRMKISNRRDEPDLLDIQMTVSTWKSA